MSSERVKTKAVSLEWDGEKGHLILTCTAKVTISLRDLGSIKWAIEEMKQRGERTWASFFFDIEDNCPLSELVEKAYPKSP